MSAAPPNPEPSGSAATGYSNVILWAAFAMVSLGVGGWFVSGVHHLASLDCLLAGAALAVRTAFYISLGLCCEALLLRGGGADLTSKRRLALHGYWIGVMVLTVAIAIDVFVFAFAGYHLTTGLRILFADGPTGFGTAMEASGLSIGLMVAGLTVCAAGLGLAAALSAHTARLSQRWPRQVAPRAACKAALLLMGLLATLDLAGLHLRNPYLWELENRRVPLAFSIVRPDATLASFRVALKPPAPLPARPAPVLRPNDPAAPDIFVVVIESLRKDLLDAAIMPNFARFAADAWTFEHPITTGNVTHYAWYGLLCAKYPVYFDVAKQDPRLHGSVPLAMLRDMGYRLNLLATPDTAYQQLESIVFGPNGVLLASKFHPTAETPQQRDRLVVNELVRRLDSSPVGGNFFLVALDSTHFDYGWDPAFVPPFTPYATGTSVMTNYQKDLAARQLVENRYKNSAAWVDMLLGNLLSALRACRRLERSMVIITGDHGEAFWEHGAGTHGSDLGSEQLEVAFAMRFPGEPATHFKTVFSLLDVMPTVLAAVGATPYPDAGLDGHAFQSRAASADARDAGYALTFQGWNEQAFRFALTDSTKRVLLELDRRDPRESSRLAVKDVMLGQGRETLTQQGNSSAYHALLADLPRIIERIPFLEFR